MDSLIPLTSTEVHLWLTFFETIRDAHLEATYRELLSSAEREQELQFYSARDRQRYLVTRALVRTVLSRYESSDPKDWIFSTNAHGKPYIVNTEAADSCLSFSVSHTHGLSVLGVAKGRSLGVDVEKFIGREVSIDIASNYFAAEEIAALREAPSDQQRYNFFEYWTFKEAYVKARGLGVSLPLDKFSIHFADEHAVSLVINPELGDDSSRWHLWEFRPSTEHLLAICAERLDTQFPKLVIRETTPGVSERKLTSQPVRSSEMEH